MKRALLLVLGLAAFVGSLWAGWTLRASNSLNIDLDLIWVRIPNVELWWVLLVAMGLGASLTLLFVSFSWLRTKLLLTQARSKVRKLEKEIHQLRSLPLVGSEPGGEALDAGLSDGDSQPDPKTVENALAAKRG